VRKTAFAYGRCRADALDGKQYVNVRIGCTLMTSRADRRRGREMRASRVTLALTSTVLSLFLCGPGQAQMADYYYGIIGPGRGQAFEYESGSIRDFTCFAPLFYFNASLINSALGAAVLSVYDDGGHLEGTAEFSKSIIDTGGQRLVLWTSPTGIKWVHPDPNSDEQQGLSQRLRLLRPLDGYGIRFPLLCGDHVNSGLEETDPSVSGAYILVRPADMPLAEDWMDKQNYSWRKVTALGQISLGNMYRVDGAVNSVQFQALLHQTWVLDYVLRK
jgi:hypothetical protein